VIQVILRCDGCGYLGGAVGLEITLNVEGAVCLEADDLPPGWSRREVPLASDPRHYCFNCTPEVDDVTGVPRRRTAWP
jgi:hypothetical protein